MSLIFGFDNEHEEPVPKFTDKKYVLEYPATTLGNAVYPERGASGGYRYIPATGFNAETTLTLTLHMFSTSTGKDMTGPSLMQYSIELLNNDGSFAYFNLRTVDLKDYKTHKSGEKYNHFLLNKKFVLSKILRTTDFSNFKLFSVYFTQYNGILSGDTSTLELIIRNVR